MLLAFKKAKLVSTVEAALNKLEALTKRLKVMPTSKNSTKRKVVVSTKDLVVSGLKEGTRIVREIKPSGLLVRPALPGDKNVTVISCRIYPNREGVEPVLDVRHQTLLDQTIGDAKYIHITFMKVGILIQPVFEHKQSVQDSALINIDNKDENGLYSSIFEALSIIREKKFAHVTFDAENEFKDSQESTLFSIQLRRLGYSITQTESNQFSACIDESIPLGHLDKISVSASSSFNDASRQQINNNFNYNDPLSTFTVCSSGVDISAMESDGFKCVMNLDFRPPEARDYLKSKCKETGETIKVLSDKSDTGAISSAINGRYMKVLFNEDINDFDVDINKDLMEPVNFVHISLLCDCYSTLKNMNDRKKSIESLNTTRDTIFPALRLVKQLKAPTLMFENVKSFHNSQEAKLLEAGLKSLGYKSFHKQVLSAVDFDGMTNRERCYIFASTLPSDFSFPEPVQRTKSAWYDVIANNMDKLRDVSHTSSVRKGIETGRIRTMVKGADYAPTITKSQSRQTKDSFYVEIDGRYYMPSNNILMELMGFDPDFDLSAFSQDISTELVGQSIEIPMHRKICQSVKKHILEYVSSVNKVGKLVTQTCKPLTSLSVEKSYKQGQQMMLVF